MKEIRESLDSYVRYKVPCGSFLTADLGNDLKEALGRADLENRHKLFEIVSFMYNNLPHNIWGSKEKVAAHLNSTDNEQVKWMDNLKRGLNIFKYDEDTLKFLPKEVTIMDDIAQQFIKDMIEKCAKEDIDVSVIPSIILQSFKSFMPAILDILREKKSTLVDNYIDFHTKVIQEIIGHLNDEKKKGNGHE